MCRACARSTAEERCRWLARERPRRRARADTRLHSPAVRRTGSEDDNPVKATARGLGARLLQGAGYGRVEPQASDGPAGSLVVLSGMLLRLVSLFGAARLLPGSPWG